MAADKIDLMGYRFEHSLQDIQTLNERAMRGELHLSAVSIHAYAHLLDTYALLPCGASMGDGYGPMFVALKGHGPAADASLEEKKAWLRTKKIAVPGLMTSAYLSAQLFLGPEFNHTVVPFDEILMRSVPAPSMSASSSTKGSSPIPTRASRRLPTWASGLRPRPVSLFHWEAT
jgi:1,4-dihydroxy-6-naphthoate synthase